MLLCVCVGVVGGVHVKSPNILIFYGLCPSVCDPMHCVNCVDSGVCLVVSPSKTCVVMVTVCVVSRLLASLVPRPKKEEEEENGPGFSGWCMRLIISHLTTC